MKNILTTQEAADYLGMKPITLEAWRRNNKGPVYSKPEGTVFYLKDDLDAFITQGRIDPKKS